MKKKKNIILLMAFFGVFVCLWTIGSTYAKYINTAEGGTNLNIARWRILVNDEDIRNNPSISGNITPVLIENEHIKPGVIAPTSSGYFDIIIDSTDVDVSFTYTITPSVPNDSCVKDLIVTGYSLNDGDIETLEDNTISNTVLYADNINLTNIRMYIEWIDDESQTMDNNDDTLATSDSDCKGVVMVSLNFVQLKN